MRIALRPSFTSGLPYPPCLPLVYPTPLVYLWFTLPPLFTSGLPYPLVYLWFTLPSLFTSGLPYPPRLPHLESSSKSSLTSLCSAELDSVSIQVPENNTLLEYSIVMVDLLKTV